MVITIENVYHGTAARFDAFRFPASGVHLGTLDQAVHAATLKLARMPVDAFAALEEDESGWRGIVLTARLRVSNIMDVEDAKTASAWARLIRSAKAQGFDCLRYVNAFEGRTQEHSYVVFDPASVEITGRYNSANVETLRAR